MPGAQAANDVLLHADLNDIQVTEEEEDAKIPRISIAYGFLNREKDDPIEANAPPDAVTFSFVRFPCAIPPRWLPAAEVDSPARVCASFDALEARSKKAVGAKGDARFLAAVSSGAVDTMGGKTGVDAREEGPGVDDS